MDYKNHYKVIVAEDEEIILNHIVKKINQTQMGFQVIGQAVTGKQALDLIDELSPDVLFTDIRMPVMDGLELLENVYSRYPHIKIVIISGYAEFEYAQKAMKYHAEDYLLKPIETEALVVTLSKIRIALESQVKALKEKFNLPEEHRSPEDIAKLLKEYIKSNFNQDINFNLIADNLNYSSGYLSKLFTQYIGVSPSKYLIDLRINRAKYLLDNYRELSIKQIGESVGYQDQSYFSRIFKNVTGKSPLTYRGEE